MIFKFYYNKLSMALIYKKLQQKIFKNGEKKFIKIFIKKFYMLIAELNIKNIIFINQTLDTIQIYYQT